MIAEILATGDEIRGGSVIDTNSAYIVEKIEQQGIFASRHICVGDDISELVSAFKEISQRAQIAVVTGGLGPTIDDLTAQAAAIACRTELVLDKQALENIENFFKSRGWQINDSNKKQAMLPKGAARLDNSAGTAPGFIFKLENCLFFCLPGVPWEMRTMLKEHVLPRIKEIVRGKQIFSFAKIISTFGLGESEVGEKTADLSDKFEGIKIGLRAVFPYIQIKLYANGNNRESLNTALQQAENAVFQRIGKKIISTKGEFMESVIGTLLQRKKATIAVAESCTGGLISSMLTDVPGSSEYFLFSAVAYSNQAKMDILGVSPQTLEKYGAVSEQTAKEMALGAKRVSGADYAVSTSGIAGPTGGTEQKPVGTVCIGIAAPNKAEGFRFHFPFPKRKTTKNIFAVKALDMLRFELAEDMV